MAPTVRAKQAQASSQTGQRTRFRAQFYKTELCQFYSEGMCSKGPSCNYAHGKHELRVPPDLAKTSMCKDWQAGVCKLSPSQCQFAHGPDELKRTEVYSNRKKSDRECLMIDQYPNQRSRGAERGQVSLEDKQGTGKAWGSSGDLTNSAEKTSSNQVPLSLMNEVDSANWMKQEELHSSSKAGVGTMAAQKILMAMSQTTRSNMEVNLALLEKALADAMPEYYED